MDNLLVEASRNHRWANLHVFDICARLSDEQLRLTSAGTYGTIANTLLHMVAAEQRYVTHLTGKKAAINERDSFPGVAKLRELATHTADQLIEVAGRSGAPGVVEVDWPEGKFDLDLGVVVLQALHHGNDHRTHICTILGQHGMECGDMDLWAYGHATGAIAPKG